MSGTSAGGAAQDLERLRAWQGQSGERGAGCVFTQALRSQPPAGDVGKYMDLYNNGDVRLPFRFENRIWQEAFERSFAQAVDRFKTVRGRSEHSIVRNFSIKLLYWIDTYFPRLFVETRKMTRFPKFACGGTVKLPEYLFLYLLFLLGCDVLYISPGEDVSVSDSGLLRPRRIVLQKLVKLFPVPVVGLFQSGQVPAGEEQAEKLLKIPGNRVDPLPGEAHGVDGKDHLPEALHETAVDAVHALPADDLGPDRGAEVATVPVPGLQAQGGEADARL